MIGFRLEDPVSNDQAVQTMLSIEGVNFEARGCHSFREA